MTPFFYFNSISGVIINGIVQFLLGYVIIKKIPIPGNYPFLRSFLLIAVIAELTTHFLWRYKVGNWQLMVVYMIIEYLFLMYLMYSWLPPRRQNSLKYYFYSLLVISLLFSLYSINNISVLVLVNGVRFFQMLVFSVFVLLWYLRYGPNEGIINPVSVLLSSIILFTQVGTILSLFLGLFKFKLPYDYLQLTSNLMLCAIIYTLITFIRTHNQKQKLLADI